jgi:hypothetical protein
MEAAPADILLSDKSGGAITVWAPQNYPLHIGAQLHDANGNALRGTYGRMVSDAVTTDSPAAAESILGGIIVAWKSGNKVYAQRLDANGNKMWNSGTGVLVFDATHGGGGPLSVCSDGIGGAYIVIARKDRQVFRVYSIIGIQVTRTGSVASCLPGFGGKYG